MLITQIIFSLGVIAILWKVSQPPDDNDKGGGDLQPVYVRK